MTEEERRRRLQLLQAQRRAQSGGTDAMGFPAQPAGGSATNPGAVDDLSARMGAAGRGALDTATFGLADEMMGVFGAIDPQSTYAMSRDEARRQMQIDQADMPGSRLAGQIGGGIASGAAVGGLIDDALRAVPALSGVGTGARIGRGVLAGGLEGGAYGFGSGEGFDDRFAQTLTYGGMGAAAGGIIPAATEAARRVALRPIGGALGVGNQSRAGNSVMRALEEAGYTPQQIDDALRTAAAEGQDVFNVADVLGVAGRRTLAGTASQPGPARSLVEEALTGRQNNQTTRLAQFVEEAMDSRNTRAQETAAARVARGEAGNINFGAARANSQPVDVRGVLGVIDDRIGPMQNTTIQGDGIDATLDGIRRRLAGVVGEGEAAVPGELSDFNRLVSLYGELSDLEQVARRSGANNRAGAILGVKNALGEALEEASPDWRSANANFAAASRVVDAPDLGQRANVGTTRSADVADQVADIEARINRIPGLTDTERAQYIADARQAFRTGYANRDLAAIEGARDTRNMAGALFENDRQRANYGLLADDPDQFFRRVGRESTMSETRNAALGGSRTAELLADQGAVNGEDISVIANLLAGRPGAAVGQVAGRTIQAASGANEGTREAIARALLSTNPGELQQMLLPAQRAEATRTVIEALLRGGSRGLIDQVAR